MKRLLVLFISTLLWLTGCHQFGGGVRGPGHHPESANLPPAHAPAHGRRAHYRYYYYPEARFYFDIGRNLYFYLDSHGRWSVSASFPSHLHRYRHSHRIELEMDIDKPYTRHHHHKKRYPPGQLKKRDKHKNKHKGKKYHDDDDEYKRKGNGYYRD